MCSVNNEAVLKALVKVKDDELTFTKALQIAQLTEEAAKLVQSTSPYPSSVNKVQTSQRQSSTWRPTSSWWQKKRVISGGEPVQGAARQIMDCPFKEAVCNYCQKMGHIQAACLKKRKK